MSAEVKFFRSIFIWPPENKTKQLQSQKHQWLEFLYDILKKSRDNADQHEKTNDPSYQQYMYII